MTARQADLAQRLISTKGRTVTFIKLNKTTTDPNKPWRGNADPRNPPEASSSQVAVFVPISSAAMLSQRTLQDELVKRSEQMCLVGPGSQSTDDLTEFDEILDSDGTRWKINFADVLQPGDKQFRILYSLGVRR